VGQSLSVEEIPPRFTAIKSQF